MGNTSKKLAAKCTLLTKEEQKYVAATFRAASKNSERIREDDLIVSGKVDAVLLEKFWGPQIDPRLAQYLTNFLFGSGQQKTATVDFNRFAELYVYNVRGTVDERMMVTYNCLGMDYNEEVELPYQLLKEYCESIASTYIKMVKSSSSKRVRVWMEKGFRASASHVQALGEAVTATIGDLESPQHHCTAAQLSKWLQSNILLKQLAELVYVNLYGINKRGGDESPTPMPPAAPSLLPIPDGLDAMPDYPAFIDLSHIVWINSHLPQKYQRKWRFLFSSHIHGESFSTMAGRIIEQGPSVLIIEDSSGHIFGGFAACAWTFGPNFTGTDESFLFTAAPKMRVYPATNYNDHYQYINHHTKTLPNGLLMGGQFHFGGIWVNADPFGEGSSAESCSTFRGYRRLSKDPTFHIRSLEVWGVGDKPLTEKEQEERDVSVLDTNPEAKAILDMAGRTRHSEGIREPPPL
ncbi:PREDICTED: TLD domain-containing protein 1 isoform X1 [Papilio xuthus]|uniref:MTOR-associated protein MEAK7 n=2 Tax=Papilio TaxID=7145 RepID=A0AAJ6YYE8_PAPXU|nr:PREDICTED: TLD domain-containing protein 1 isoform X1 [Papilio xuthus]XP_013161296.1 PREDICTED: TLD domain-containing protein 1 isoform X1 [Papilio xuthus]XP_013161303.1 PREDICTED: TLD domain-containing protein 1 isoform X1 [Papilio xuthus]XP_013161309.1 PREDICTED: TLD domain-containing protein 1 isoform X1 [Papilio xuthus]XP_013161316.1 PREDICTED: TLD domain-containing protein 1 isoform X1 [Papilio xuthus]